MAVTAHMPENPAELQDFVRSVVDMRVMELQKETLEELRHLGEGQARVEGRLDELAGNVRLYREDFHLLVDRSDHFQVETRREHEVFRRETGAEHEKFRHEMRDGNEKFWQDVRAENEKFRQEVWGRFEKVDDRFEKIDQRFERIDERFDRIDGRFERLELRLFEMQRSLTVQTRWLITLLIAAPVIYSVMDRIALKVIP